MKCEIVSLALKKIGTRQEWRFMMNCSRGDVVLLLFPHSDLITAKRRPALIVQADNINTGIAQKVVAMMTTNPLRTGPTRVRVEAQSETGKAMGITVDSIIVCDNLATVLNAQIDQVIGRCSVMPEVDAALRTALALQNNSLGSGNIKGTQPPDEHSPINAK